MDLVYTGGRDTEFGIVGDITGVRYRIIPGERVSVDDQDGEFILARYAGLFTEVKTSKPEEPKSKRKAVLPVIEAQEE